MSNKQRAIGFCKEYLAVKSLSSYFSLTDFNSYYRKNNNAWGNPYYVGIGAADFMIANYSPAEIRMLQNSLALQRVR